MRLSTVPRAIAGWLFAAFSTICPALPAAAKPSHVVAITFDDLPYVQRAGAEPAARLLAAVASEHAIVGVLRARGIPATGFVNEDKVRDLGVTGVQLIAQWNTGLLELGNHGATHFDSNVLTLADIEYNVVAGGEDIQPLAARAGRRVTFFRFPYNHVGDTDPRRGAIEALVARYGYRLAETTIDNEDPVFNDAYECAFAAHAEADIDRIRAAYLAYTSIEIDYYRGLDERVTGRDIPAIMLLHANRLNAAVLPDVVDLFSRRGYRFVTLAQAQSDPVFTAPPAYATRYGPMWGYRWAHAHRISVDGRQEKEPPRWIAAYCSSRR